MIFRNTTAEQFLEAVTPEDKFAKTFMSKATLQNQWDDCIGAWSGEELLGAIITTVSARRPYIANLQLLQTFHKHRGKGIARALCKHSLKRAIMKNAKYYRVSSEVDAIEFYKKIGLTFLGEQKSGCQLSMFKIDGPEFTDGIYDINNPVIYKAVHRKGKGGCVEVFVESDSKLSEFL